MHPTKVKLNTHSSSSFSPPPAAPFVDFFPSRLVCLPLQLQIPFFVCQSPSLQPIPCADWSSHALAMNGAIRFHCRSAARRSRHTRPLLKKCASLDKRRVRCC